MRVVFIVPFYAVETAIRKVWMKQDDAGEPRGVFKVLVKSLDSEVTPKTFRDAQLFMEALAETYGGNYEIKG